MRIVSVLILDIGEAKNVELFLTTSTSGVDWEQDRPCDTAADEAYNDSQFEIAQQKVSIQRIVLENVFIRNLEYSVSRSEAPSNM
jgi:hypothetical protein